MNIIQIGCDICIDDAFTLVSENREKIEKLIIIDAMPTAIKIAKEKYNFLGSKFIAVQCAIGTINGVVEIFHTNDSTGRCAQASLLKDFISQIHSDVISTYVPCLTINDFLKSINLKALDYLFIDVEGLDAMILLDMDFDRFLPNTIMCEYSHADGLFKTTEKYELLLKKLISYNYKVDKLDRFNMRCTL